MARVTALRRPRPVRLALGAAILAIAELLALAARQPGFWPGST